ncbi:CocE/NonD family hydrolase [Rubrobacter marinus]|uniref:CocE/NonD family hydrolase n=1 Tax=Rubrobacter marinus TaxID=2653852 RepID=A0A6G8Q2W2_9ACTN|nr:CocE/NonD family hydrolase [Rubrobacter marinus]
MFGSILSQVLERVLELPPARTRKIEVTRNLRVPMRDGVVLLADRYAPEDGGAGDAAELPTVLVRSPYGKGGLHSVMYGRPFAERGYEVVIQSCRGTEHSGGILDPFRQEAADGLDTLVWLGRQPWAGDVVTTGPSYLGFSQWALASALASVPDDGSWEGIPRPRAMAVQLAPSDFREPVYEGGSFALHTFLRWTRQRWNFERDEPLHLVRAFGRVLLGVEGRAVGRAEARLPLGDLDRWATGRRVDYWQGWLEHDAPHDPWWDSARHGDAVAGITAPVHLLGGRYDLFLPGLLRDYARLRDAGRQPRLTIGPWAHEDPAWVPVATREALAFFDTHAKGERGRLRDTPVRVHVGGAEEWRDYPDFPPPGVRAERWHLHGGHLLAREAPGDSPPEGYRYDPADPTPSVGGPLFGRGAGPRDNRALEARPDVLTYTSEPLGRNLEVVGPVEAELWVRSSLAHADFFARLCDVEPSGRSVNVSDALLRVSPGRPEPEEDETLQLRIELWPTAHSFRRGHRLRVQISSGAHPRLARNTGSGEPLAAATKLVAAAQQVFHDPLHPSAVVLSVLA